MLLKIQSNWSIDRIVFNTLHSSLIAQVCPFVLQCAMGLYFYLKEVQHAEDVVAQISWLPVVALVIFISTYSVGWGPLPWAMMGEMFASNVKAKASSVTVSLCWILSFIITKFSTNIIESFGNYVVFWLFDAFCILSILFTVFLLPETKGKSLQEIQNELSGVAPTIPDLENGSKKWRGICNRLLWWTMYAKWIE